MKKLHLLLVSIVLFNTLSMQSMENQKQLTLAEKYKDAYLITQLPEESLLIENQSLKDST